MNIYHTSDRPVQEAGKNTFTSTEPFFHTPSINTWKYQPIHSLIEEHQCPPRPRFCDSQFGWEYCTARSSNHGESWTAPRESD
ncbi:hypothetical protein VIGAN_01401800 [Vigna angularis var. angularis]|uniref:Uncharacterized protein n=1 Tax=Vigna angularis var. angularis TaxID=157739 RepID=A0A0S3R648_PHAAN|nr:hypothetical protein VIGAN_01401800 [Vigna angularis var. angularis]